MRDQRTSPRLAVDELDELGVRLLAHQRAAAGQRRERSGSPSGVSSSQRAMICGIGAREQRLRGGEPEHAHGGLVRVDQAAVGPLRGDRVRDALEDRAQVVGHEPLAELRGAQLGDVLEGHERGRRRRRARRSSARVARSVRSPRGVWQVDHRAAHALAARGAHGGQRLLGERPALGVAARAGRHPLGRGAPDGVLLAGQLERRAVGEQHARAARLDDHDGGRAGRRAASAASGLGRGGRGHGLPPHRRESNPAERRATRGPRPRIRAGSPRTAGGGPPRRAGSRSPCPGSRSRRRR